MAQNIWGITSYIFGNRCDFKFGDFRVGIGRPVLHLNSRRYYPSCEDCKFYGSVFGIINLSSCDSILLKLFFFGFLALPNFVFAALAIIPVALMEKSNPVLRWGIAIVLLGISALTALRAVRKRKGGGIGFLGLASHFSVALIILYITYFDLSL